MGGGCEVDQVERFDDAAFVLCPSRRELERRLETKGEDNIDDSSTSLRRLQDESLSQQGRLFQLRISRHALLPGSLGRSITTGLPNQTNLEIDEYRAGSPDTTGRCELCAASAPVPPRLERLETRGGVRERRLVVTGLSERTVAPVSVEAPPTGTGIGPKDLTHRSTPKTILSGLEIEESKAPELSLAPDMISLQSVQEKSGNLVQPAVPVRAWTANRRLHHGVAALTLGEAFGGTGSTCTVIVYLQEFANGEEIFGPGTNMWTPSEVPDVAKKSLTGVAGEGIGGPERKGTACGPGFGPTEAVAAIGAAFAVDASVDPWSPL
ncbi:hypothetical protein AK812_SmicGene6765 [Symbiodinium microadriaticum]|uniref:Uncharacterized protein n=1 Tax=Symbiodinium microadriaticum TaxID=2951 RepID=A0A1Q9EQ84_SYMMI|nr:hypothetical protein AK812_SmicGene6765 [Symbiodinium microadriaticum]